MNTLINFLKTYGDDVDYSFNEDNDLEIIFNDFAGFNEDYEEITREFTNPNVVEEVIQYLDNNTKYIGETGVYSVYSLEDHDILVGYASYDI